MCRHSAARSVAAARISSFLRLFAAVLIPGWHISEIEFSPGRVCYDWMFDDCHGAKMCKPLLMETISTSGFVDNRHSLPFEMHVVSNEMEARHEQACRWWNGIWKKFNPGEIADSMGKL